MKISGFMMKQIASCLVLLLAISFETTAASAQQQAAAPDQPAQQAQSGQSGSTPADAAPQSSTTKPVGTAVAPYEKTTGITASRPAGAVIAPAKQRRMRSILIKVGIIAGAGIAAGAVIALSRASPSQPH
jgi:hypothetical protein